MNLKSFWERNRAQRWQKTGAAPAAASAKSPKPIEPLTHEASTAVLEDAIEWLIEETTATLREQQ